MLSSGLGDVGVLVLTNQCWDRALTRRAAEKAASELPSGAVVIEYTGAVKPWFRPLTSIAAPVSWNADHVFHVWVKP
ncbi:hypothetical protein V8C86DRAFT_2691285 [Haematococcus lacustris]